MRKIGFLVFVTGLALLSAYWYSVMPLGGRAGYAEDICYPDLARHLMSDQIKDYGKPTFITDQFMTPTGMSVPYMVWQPERDWLGSKIWDWNRNFPFTWVYFGVSLLITYLGVGFILRKMGLPVAWSWGVASAVVLFHVPRHFKIWHAFDLLPEHWLYWGFFLDAWIWQKFKRKGEYSVTLELWRILISFGAMGTAGYFWGPLILEWVLVRGFMLAGARKNWRSIQLEIPRPLVAFFPLAIIAVYTALWVRWYIPLFEEARKGGTVQQGLSWFANFTLVVRPLWYDVFFHPLHPLDTPETLVTVGWFYWIPFFWAVSVLWKKKKQKMGEGALGLGVIAPFLSFLIIGILYATNNNKPFLVQRLVQGLIPFMSYFRVASRWGVFLPQILTLVIVLAWPELTRSWERITSTREGKIRMTLLTCAFLAMSGVEASWLVTEPINMMPPISPGLKTMLEKIREAPGTSVLDMPFCVAGGNGVCTTQECPNYPASTIGQCMRDWHDKKVYGLYSGRLFWENCGIYNRAPYTSWFEAWGQQRCFSPMEWDQFCGYLDQHTEISAILLYPEIWNAMEKPECAAEWDHHLGPPLDTQIAMTAPSRGGAGERPTRIMRYTAHCLK